MMSLKKKEIHHFIHNTNNQQNALQSLRFFSLNCHQHVSAAIAAIFSVMLLLQEYKGTNVISCADVTT